MVELEKILEDLLEIPSPSGNESEIMSYLEKFLTNCNFEVERQEISGLTPVLLARRGNNSFYISTHADTVKTENSYRKIDDFVYQGIGTADTKGQLAALLSAVSSSDYPATLFITVDEELEGRGSANFEAKEEIKGILVLEPTEFTICTHQGGAIEIQVTVESESYHASMSNAEINPVNKLVQFLHQVRDFRENSAFISKWKLPAVTPYFFNSGNPDIYVSPAKAECKLDLAVAPEEDAESIYREIEKIARKNGVEIIWYEIEPGFELDRNSEIAKIVSQAFSAVTGSIPEQGTMPSWTDAANFALKGYHTVVFGAGSLKYAHTKKESIDIRELQTLSKVLIEFLSLTAKINS